MRLTSETKVQEIWGDAEKVLRLFQECWKGEIRLVDNGSNNI